jgi:hypothetical protein
VKLIVAKTERYTVIKMGLSYFTRHKEKERSVPIKTGLHIVTSVKFSILKRLFAVLSSIYVGLNTSFDFFLCKACTCTYFFPLKGKQKRPMGIQVTNVKLKQDCMRAVLCRWQFNSDTNASTSAKQRTTTPSYYYPEFASSFVFLSPWLIMLASCTVYNHLFFTYFITYVVRKA